MAALPVAEGQQKSAISLAKDSDSEEKSQLEKKLESILNDAEEQKTFNSQNFVSLKTLVFIWVIGSETSCRKAELLFKEEIKKIVSDIRTV